MNVKEIIVDSVKIKKTGTTNGNDWAISTVKDISGEYFDTFDKFIEGETVEVEVTENENPKYNSNIKRVSDLPPHKKATHEKFNKADISVDDSILYQVCLKEASALVQVNGFGEATTEENQIKYLNDMAFNLAKGAKSNIRLLKNH